MAGFDDYLTTSTPADVGDLLFTRGDAWRMTVKLVDADGVAVPVGGLVFTLELSAWGTAAWSTEGTATATGPGEVELELSVLDTSAMPADRLALALRVDQGSVRKTLIRGWLLDAIANAADRGSSSCTDHSESLLAPDCPPQTDCTAPTCVSAVQLRPCGRAVVTVV